MQTLLLNLRMSIRSLRKSPGFTVTALLTIALAIGAVTSVFSVVNTVLLKPFAFHDPGQLAILREVVGTRGKTIDRARQLPALPTPEEGRQDD